MRRIAAAAAAATLAGCGGWGNPYDSSDLQEALVEQDARLLELELAANAPRALPEHPPFGDLQPNLDAWRATVVERADAVTLRALAQESRARIEFLRALLRELEASPHRIFHYEELVVRRDIAFEERKIEIVEAAR